MSESGSKLRNLTSAAMIRAGQLRPLAIVTERASPDYPDVPTMGEVGFGDIGTLQLLALFAPAGFRRPSSKLYTRPQLRQ